jgi:protein-S-isoprenylcysteine O-methyltransferase Ste14
MKRSPTETIDIGIGMVGFFAFAFFVIAGLTELAGGDALGWAMTLLVLVLLLGALLWWRHRMSRRARVAQPRG